MLKEHSLFKYSMKNMVNFTCIIEQVSSISESFNSKILQKEMFIVKIHVNINNKKLF